MKRIIFTISLASLQYFTAAQTVALNTAFGSGGQVETGLFLLSGNPYGLDLAALPDGEIVIAGGYTNLTALKYDAQGAPNSFFETINIPTKTHTVGLCARDDGKILLTAEDTVSANTLVVRLNPDGNLDSSFGDAGLVRIQAGFSLFFNVFAQSDGKIILYGMRCMGVNNYVFSAIRLLDNGDFDHSFGTNGEVVIDLPGVKLEAASSAVEQPDHKLLFAGGAVFNGWKIMMLRLNPDGSLDTLFGNGGAVIDPVSGNSESYAVALQPDGKILLSGYALPEYEAIVVRYDNEGSLDEEFANNGVHYFPETNECIGIVLKPDGKILTAHWENTEEDNIALAQLLPNGERDESFGAHGVFKIENAYARPKAFVFRDNRATISTLRDYHKVLFSIVLDLNVGVLDPQAPLATTALMYPNPPGEYFALKFELLEKQNLSIRMYDLSGRLIESLLDNQVLDAGEHTLNLACPIGLTPGNYILAIEIDGKRITAVQLSK